MRILKIESYSKVLPRYSHHAYLRVYIMKADVYLDLCVMYVNGLPGTDSVRKLHNNA